MNSFFTLHSFLEVGKTQDLPTKFWQTLGDALKQHEKYGYHQSYWKHILLCLTIDMIQQPHSEHQDYKY
jgi:hypothetical protein